VLKWTNISKRLFETFLSAGGGRKRRISKVILGGMLANICVESHLRDLLEQGFEVVVAMDATAGPRHPEWGTAIRRRSSTLRFSHTRFCRRTRS
jgi:nicotinamidase-related amidase